MLKSQNKMVSVNVNPNLTLKYSLFKDTVRTEVLKSGYSVGQSLST